MISSVAQCVIALILKGQVSPTTLSLIIEFMDLNLKPIFKINHNGLIKDSILLLNNPFSLRKLVY